MKHDQKILRETQTFMRWWWLLLMPPVWIGPLLGAGMLYKSGGQDPEGWQVLGISLVALALTAGLLATMRLETEAREDGFYYRLWPFHLTFRRIAKADVVQVETCSYDPLREYGGWGIRRNVRTGTRAFNVYGREGIRFVLADGAKVLIGTQQRDAWHQWLQHWQATA